MNPFKAAYAMSWATEMYNSFTIKLFKGCISIHYDRDRKVSSQSHPSKGLTTYVVLWWTSLQKVMPKWNEMKNHKTNGYFPHFIFIHFPQTFHLLSENEKIDWSIFYNNKKKRNRTWIQKVHYCSVYSRMSF